VAGGFLHVAQRDTSIQRGGDKRVPQCVWTNPLGDASSTGDAAHDPSRRMSVKALTVGPNKEGSFASLADREIDRACRPGSERNRDDLASLACNGEGTVAAFEAERFDVGTEPLRRPATH
jgi:hypothetical protein